MGWSMTSVSFRMSGSGSWQNLLPDESSRRQYSEIYPMGAPLPTGPGPLLRLFSVWEQAAIVRFENEKVIPLGPIMTDDDLTILKPWFQDISNFMGQAVLERLDDYRALARTLVGGHSSAKQAVDNLLTILICALTLDSWVFTRLRREVIGTYPLRDFAGTFFFWGYAFAAGPQRIFGFTTYNGSDLKQLHVMRSHGLDRRNLKTVLNQRRTWDYLNRFFNEGQESKRTNQSDWRQSPSWKAVEDSLQKAGLLNLDHPPGLAIPLFAPQDQETISELCRETSKKITGHFMARDEPAGQSYGSVFFCPMFPAGCVLHVVSSGLFLCRRSTGGKRSHCRFPKKFRRRMGGLDFLRTLFPSAGDRNPICLKGHHHQ